MSHQTSQLLDVRELPEALLSSSAEQHSIVPECIPQRHIVPIKGVYTYDPQSLVPPPPPPVSGLMAKLHYKGTDRAALLRDVKPSTALNHRRHTPIYARCVHGTLHTFDKSFFINCLSSANVDKDTSLLHAVDRRCIHKLLCLISVWQGHNNVVTL